MAHSCVSFQRFNSLVFSSSNSSSTCSSHPKFLSIPFDPRCSRKSNQKNLRSVSVKAVFSGGFLEEFVASDSVHKVGDDLQIPSSPYFPAYAQGQGPPPMVQERFQSVISQLFQHRIIRCGGAVDNDVANIIVAQLLFLDAVDPKKDIVIHVNSPGGSVTAGMAIFDTMRHIRPDVSTVCVGLAARLCHGRGNNTLEKTNQDTDRDFFMSAKEAKENGLIDGVIMNPLKALQPLAATASP